MSDLTEAQKLAVRQAYQNTQLDRTQERDRFKLIAPAGRNEAKATLALLRGIDTYLQSSEGRLATDNNALYSAMLEQRDVVCARCNTLCGVKAETADA